MLIRSALLVQPLRTFQRFLTQFITLESFVFLMFIFMQIPIKTNKLYVVLAGAYVLAQYMLTKRAITTAWILFLSTLLFLQAKFFREIIAIPTPQEIIHLPVLYNISFSDVALCAVVFLLLRDRILSRKERAVRSIEYLFLPILVISILSSWLSVFQIISFFYVIQVAKYFIIFLTSSVLLRDKHRRVITFEILFLFVLFNSVLLFLQKFHGGPFGLPIEHLNIWSEFGRYAVEQQDLFRPGGTMDDPNLIASVIGLVFPLAFFASVVRGYFHRRFVHVVTVAAAAGLVFTGSRAVWFVVVGVVVYGFYLHKRLGIRLNVPDFRTRTSMIRVLLFAIILLPFILFRIYSLSDVFREEGSGAYRIKHIEIAKDYALSYPFGVGVYVFQYVTPLLYEKADYAYEPAEPHNIFAHIGAELGLLGLLLFCYLFFRIMSRKFTVAIRTRDSFRIAVFLSCVSYLSIASFYPWFIYAPISELFWMLMGMDIYERSDITYT